MTAFPVIERELRQQARRPSVAWVRVIAAMLAGLAAVGVLGSTTSGRVGGLMPGQIVFNTLSVVALVFCLFEGVRQTADCLASEKREGTLGLLLLTDLRGLDVVLGKLAATSVGSFYVLMAIFPALAMALPYGGVTSGEFWRTQLVLVNTLFVALGVGMWASARERETGRAWTVGFTTILLLTLLPMILEVLLKRGPVPSVSPGVALQLAGDSVYAKSALRFWLTVLTLQGVGWSFLALAGRRLVRSWQDEERPSTVKALLELSQPRANEPWAPEGEPVWSEDLATIRSTGPGVERPERELIDRNPAEWLAAWVPQHRFLAGLAVYLLAGGIFLGAVVGLMLGLGFGGPSLAMSWLTGFLPWVLLAYVSSRPMAEARRSGALELLLSTPLPVEAMVNAHWMGLWRQLRGPFKVSCALLALIFLFSMAAVLTEGGLTDRSMIVVYQLVGCASRLLTGLAICRMGLYFGLSARSTFTAVAQNLLWSVVIAWVLNQVVGLMISPTFTMSGLLLSYWILSFVREGATIAFAIFLIWWSRMKLLERFRVLSSEVR